MFVNDCWDLYNFGEIKIVNENDKLILIFIILIDDKINRMIV